jgi:hypothetical protein
MRRANPLLPLQVLGGLLDGDVYHLYCSDDKKSRYTCRGAGSSVSIVTGYGVDGPGIESPCYPYLRHLSKPALWLTQPSVQWIPGLSRG